MESNIRPVTSGWSSTQNHEHRHISTPTPTTNPQDRANRWDGATSLILLSNWHSVENASMIHIVTFGSDTEIRMCQIHHVCCHWESHSDACINAHSSTQFVEWSDDNMDWRQKIEGVALRQLFRNHLQMQHNAHLFQWGWDSTSCWFWICALHPKEELMSFCNS